MKHATADMMWPIANQIPVANKNQIMLPIRPSGLVPMSVSFGQSITWNRFPDLKWENEKLPITKHALPHGIPSMVSGNASSPKNHHANPINTPPNRNQMMFPIVSCCLLQIFESCLFHMPNKAILVLIGSFIISLYEPLMNRLKHLWLIHSTKR